MTFSRRLCGTLFLGHPPRRLFVVLGVAGLLVGGGGGAGGGRVAVAQSQPPSVETAKSAEALGKLKEWLASPVDSRAKLVDQPWSKTALSREDADAAERLLWTDHSARLKTDRAKEMEAK
ncbi:MAG TPA: hypothetical protein PLV92_22585, partial [Pirellulaceae bacterium]|nr:hypothetical protein [Pirellulaceae bacterium]